MNKKSLTRLLAVAAAALLILAACGSDDDSSSGSSEAEASASAPATTEAAMNMTPGEGVSVTAGRANWSTGYVQAEIYTALLRELGYTVSESARQPAFRDSDCRRRINHLLADALGEACGAQRLQAFFGLN